MRFGFKIARRFLKSNMSQTLFIILGIAVGVSVQIFIGSLIQGLQKSLLEKTIGDAPHITISSTTEDKKIKDYEEIVNQIKLYDSQIEKISVVEDNPAFAKIDDQTQSLLIRGFDIKKADKIYDLLDRIVEGTYPQNENEIMLGTDWIEDYKVKLGDTIELINTNQDIKKYKIVGFFDLKVASLNKNWGIMTLSAAQHLFETDNLVSSIEIQVADNAVFQTDTIADELLQKLDHYNVKVDNWKNQNEQLLSGLQGQSISSIMIQVFVMISVILGIASVLAITVMQKSKQIGILKAMGITNRTSGYIFLFEGFVLGMFGAILGILLGLGLSFAFTKFALNTDGTPVVPLFISSSFITLSGVIAVIASMCAALIPAIRSSSLNPIDIIRNN